jgi:hypothetical protein
MTAQALDVILELLSPGLAGRALRRDELHVERVRRPAFGPTVARQLEPPRNTKSACERPVSGSCAISWCSG